ncbi:MAG: cytochrome c oxidase subunit 3 [Bacteroidota bacterium]
MSKKDLEPHDISYEEDTVALTFHPYNILLTFTLAGITALFFAFSAAYLYTRVTMGIPPIKLPSLFFVNTALLLGTSYTMVLAKKAYLADNTERYKQMLAVTIVMSVIFVIAQLIAWQQLFGQQIFINYSTTASYVYVISGLHFAHVLAGLPFLGLFLWTANRKMRDPVSVLVYFSDPEKQLKLKLLTRYWHYLDALWIYLVVFFTLNHLLS